MLHRFDFTQSHLKSSVRLLTPCYKIYEAIFVFKLHYSVVGRLADINGFDYLRLTHAQALTAHAHIKCG